LDAYKTEVERLYSESGDGEEARWEAAAKAFREGKVVAEEPFSKLPRQSPESRPCAVKIDRLDKSKATDSHQNRMWLIRSNCLSCINVSVGVLQGSRKDARRVCAGWSFRLSNHSRVVKYAGKSFAIFPNKKQLSWASCVQCPDFSASRVCQKADRISFYIGLSN